MRVHSSAVGWHSLIENTDWPVSGESPSTEIDAVNNREVADEVRRYYGRLLEGVEWSRIHSSSSEMDPVDNQEDTDDIRSLRYGHLGRAVWSRIHSTSVEIDPVDNRESADEYLGHSYGPFSSFFVGPKVWSTFDLNTQATDLVVILGVGIDCVRDPMFERGGSWAKYLNQELERFAFRPETVPTAISISVMMQVSKEATSLLPRSMPKPAVVPTKEGSIELEWRKSRMHLRLAFYGSSAYVWVDNLITGEFSQGSLDDCRELVRSVAARMSEN